MRFFYGISAAALLLGTSVCDGPDDEGPPVVTVRGSIVRDDGSAAGGVVVRLLREAEEVASVETDAEGDYAFEIDREELAHATLGTAFEHGVRAALSIGEEDVEVGLDFAVRGSLSLPMLRFLEAPLSYSAGGGQLTATIPNYADGNDRRPEGYELTVRSQTGWLLATGEAGASSSSVGVPLALLEDYTCTLQLRARLTSTVGGEAVTGFAAGAATTLFPQSPAPISRGASCSYASTAEQTPIPLVPCPITDGDLATAVSPGGPICADPDPTDAMEECAATWEQMEVDLGLLHDVTVFAVHDVPDSGAILLERSEDGQVYTNITTLGQDGFLLDAPFTARFLRLSYAGQDTESVLAGLNEIVVYGD